MSKDKIIEVAFGVTFIVCGVVLMAVVFPIVAAMLLVAPLSTSSIVLGVSILRDVKRKGAA